MDPNITEAMRILSDLAERLADDNDTDYSPQIDQLIRVIDKLADKVERTCCV